MSSNSKSKYRKTVMGIPPVKITESSTTEYGTQRYEEDSVVESQSRHVDSQTPPDLPITMRMPDEGDWTQNYGPQAQPNNKLAGFKQYSAWELRGHVVGDYALVEKIDEGGMGVIYKAKQRSIPRETAVKVIDPVDVSVRMSGKLHPEEIKSRFLREVRLLAELQDHPNIVTVFGGGAYIAPLGDPKREFLWLAMELLKGDTLDVIVPRLNFDGRLRYAIQMCEAVYACHRKGIIHRDLKPQNMKTIGNVLKLLDFGIAKPVGNPAFLGEHEELVNTRDGTLLCTPQYMAPEQFKGQYTVKSDIYSMGVVLYELFSGKKAFCDFQTAAEMRHAIERITPPSLRVDNPKMSKRLDDLLTIMLAKDPDFRLDSMFKVCKELKEIQGEREKIKQEAVTDTVRNAPALSNTQDVVPELASAPALIRRRPKKQNRLLENKQEKKRKYLLYIAATIALIIFIFFFGVVTALITVKLTSDASKPPVEYQLKQRVVNAYVGAVKSIQVSKKPALSEEEKEGKQKESSTKER